MKRRRCSADARLAALEVEHVVAVAAVRDAAPSRDEAAVPQPTEVVRDQALPPTCQLAQLADAAITPCELAEKLPPKRVSGQLEERRRLHAGDNTSILLDVLCPVRPLSRTGESGCRAGRDRLASRSVEFSRELRDDVLAGDITLSVRLWQRPQVKEGGRYRVGLGLIEIDAVELVPFSAITEEDVRQAGEPDRETLRERAAHAGPIDEDTLVYRIELHAVSP
jgi:hypothetical protein